MPGKVSDQQTSLRPAKCRVVTLDSDQETEASRKPEPIPTLPPPLEGVAERRRETRYPCNEDVQVRVLPGDGRLLKGRMIDLSRSGLRIEIESAVTKGSEVEIILPKEVIIFGEARYSRRSGETHQVGIMIQDVFYSKAHGEHHVHADQLSRYMEGKGLTVPEAISVRHHLQYCRYCRSRMSDPDVLPS